MPRPTVEEVFKPVGIPDKTYVRRSEVEENFQRRLRVPGEITLLVGPSKVGKTVLCTKMIGEKRMVSIRGSHFGEGEDAAMALWKGVCSQLTGVASREVIRTVQQRTAVEYEGNLGVGLGLASLSGGKSRVNGNESLEVHRTYRDILMHETAVQGLLAEDKVLVLEDFHYAKPEARIAVAQELKYATEVGVRVVVLSTRLSASDLTSANPELRGRVHEFRLDYWQPIELLDIPKQGFAALGVSIDSGLMERLTLESLGCPQLAQQVCLQLCLLNGVHERLDGAYRLQTQNRLERAFQRAIGETYGDLTHRLLEGPARKRGPRVGKMGKDGRLMDIYALTSRALSQDPPRLTTTVTDIVRNARNLLVESSPSAVQMTQVINTWIRMLRNNTPTMTALERRGEQVAVHDPYLLFHWRWMLWGADRSTNPISHGELSAANLFADTKRYHESQERAKSAYARTKETMPYQGDMGDPASGKRSVRRKAR